MFDPWEQLVERTGEIVQSTASDTPPNFYPFYFIGEAKKSYGQGIRILKSSCLRVVSRQLGRPFAWASVILLRRFDVTSTPALTARVPRTKQLCKPQCSLLKSSVPQKSHPALQIIQGIDDVAPVLIHYKNKKWVKLVADT